MGFGLYKETIGDILQTFLFLPNLILKKWKSFCMFCLICSYTILLVKPTKPCLLSLSQRKIETDSNSVPIALGLGTMGEGIVGVSFL